MSTRTPNEHSVDNPNVLTKQPTRTQCMRVGGTVHCARVSAHVSRDRNRRKIKNQENDAPPEKIKQKIVFFDLRNPPKNFTPLFGEVAKFRTLTKKDER